MSKGRPCKPSCYLEKCYTGWFMTECVYSWIARDDWHHEVARGKTRKECEKEARRAGYTPR